MNSVNSMGDRRILCVEQCERHRSRLWHYTYYCYYFCSNIHMSFVSNLIPSFCLSSFERVFCFRNSHFKWGSSLCRAAYMLHWDENSCITFVQTQTHSNSLYSICFKLLCESFRSKQSIQCNKKYKKQRAEPNRLIVTNIFCAYRLHFKVEPKTLRHTYVLYMYNK